MGLLRQKWGNNLTIIGEETCEIPNLSKYPNLKLIDLEKVCIDIVSSYFFLKKNFFRFLPNFEKWIWKIFVYLLTH